MVRLLTVLALALMAAAPLAADDLLASYSAYIGRDDLYNSKGQRLQEPWQILRQDRANFHRFGIRQPGDDWDPFFGDINNRAIMERMVMTGRIDTNAARILVEGGATIWVDIYGYGDTGRSVQVSVSR